MGTYTVTVTEVYNFLCNYNKDPKNIIRLIGGNINSTAGIVFLDSNKYGTPTNEKIWKLRSPQTPVGSFLIAAGNPDAHKSNATHLQMLLWL